MPKVRSGEKLREYRRSYDYRKEYFKRNPGIFGCLWFCSQCYKPLIGKKNVYVDHIIPLSKGGLNKVSNCTAICGKCNREKSDKVDGRVIKGAAFKMLESSVFKAQKGVGGLAAAGTGLMMSTASKAVSVGKSGIKKSLFGIFRLAWGVVKFAIGALTYPLRSGGYLSRLFFLALYTLAVLYALKTYTPLLDAWM